LRGFQALRSAVGAVDTEAAAAAAAAAAAVAAPTKKQPTLRFNTESGRAFKWPTEAAAAVAVAPKDMGVFTFCESKEASTSEAKSHFVIASSEGLVAMRAPRGSGNLSNQSDPTLLAHKFLNVKARVYPRPKVTAACQSEIEIKAPDSHDEEDAGTLTAESEMYSGDELEGGDASSAAALVPDRGEYAEPETVPQANTVPSPQVKTGIVEAENYAVAGARLRATTSAPAPKADKLSFGRPRKAHLRGKALMLDKQKKASQDAALGHIANAKNGAKKGSPITRNSRYPGSSDAQNGRWRTEAASQFVWRPRPLQL